MKNFQFLFAAWVSVWAVFFAYEISVARRVSRLKDEVQRLSQHFREAKLM
jgi:hypothetical protein